MNQVKKLRKLKFEKWVLHCISLGFAPLMIWLAKQVKNARQTQITKSSIGSKILLWLLDCVTLGLAPLSQSILKSINNKISEIEHELLLINVPESTS